MTGNSFWMLLQAILKPTEPTEWVTFVLHRGQGESQRWKDWEPQLYFIERSSTDFFNECMHHHSHVQKLVLVCHVTSEKSLNVKRSWLLCKCKPFEALQVFHFF